MLLILVVGVGTADAQSKKKEKDTPITVSGHVVNANGHAMMGVEITMQDSFLDAETDEMGFFTITVPKKGSVLVFRDPLYLEHVVTVNDGNFMEIVMKEAPAGQRIEDKVIMPWRTTQSRNVTGAVSTIKFNDVKNVPVTSLGNALQGQAPGYIAKQEAGSPGSDESINRIRGIRTLYDGGTNAMTVYGTPKPLYIVDGFERAFTELDPAEIESVSVLKDAIATALYGARGANGVIMVNTKRGETNKRTIDLKVASGVAMPTTLPTFLGAYDYATLYNEALVNDGMAPLYTEQDLELYRTGASPLTHPDVNFYDEFIKKAAPYTNASLSMRGGNQIARYNVVVAYTSQDGIFNHTNQNPDYNTDMSYSKINLRSNLDVNITKWLVVSGDVSQRIEQRNNSYADISTIFAALDTPPNAYPLSFTGIDPTLNKEIFMLGGNSIYKDNPLGLLSYNGYTENTRRYYQATARVTADLSDFVTPGLSIQAAYYQDGYNSYTVSKNQDFLVWQYGKDVNGNDTYTSFGTANSLTTEGSYGVERYNGFDANVRYNRDFGNHSINAMALYYRHRTELRKPNQSDEKYENYGFMANYSYKNRYFLDFASSYMGTDKFYDTNSRRVFYPAVGAGWVISDEPFMSWAGALDYLKLRGSYGMTGNSEYTVTDVNGDDERYPNRQRWWTSSSKQYFGTSLTSVIIVNEGRLASEDVTVEKARMMNVALDGQMFKNRLSFTAEYWREHRFDIYTVGLGSIPRLAGLKDARLPVGNEGIVDSQGYEFSLGWSDHVGKFSYSLRAYTDWNQSIIKEMSEPFRDYENLVQTGYRTRQGFGMKYIGLFKDWDDINNSPQQMFGDYKPGDLKYEDVNGDGVVDSNDMVAVGEGSDPTRSYVFQLKLAYGGFDFSAMLQGNSGKSDYFSRSAWRAFYSNGGVSEIALGRYRTYEDGTNNWETATYPRLTTTDTSNNYRYSDFWIKSGAFLRLKTIELGYSLPKKLLDGVQMSECRIYLCGYNALTWSYVQKYGMDAEDASAGTYRYPMMRIFNLGLNLIF